MNAKIMGTGYELPAFRADNDYLATLVDTSDEWIRERTGICARHLAKEEPRLPEIRIHRVRPAKYRHRLAQTMRWHLI